jgi:hypothetical protein
MTLQTAMLATLIVILGAAQYALCVQAIRDLVRRPRVRGENKVLWAIAILCLPIGGAIAYNWMGPTSFLHRPVGTNGHSSSTNNDSSSEFYEPFSNVTPISAARSAQRRRVATPPPATRSQTTRRPPDSIGRTGS